MFARPGHVAWMALGCVLLSACTSPPEVQVGIYTVMRATLNEDNCHGEGPSRDPLPRFVRITHPTDTEFNFGECDESTCLLPVETWTPEERFFDEQSSIQSWVAERSECSNETPIAQVTTVRTTLIPRGDTVRVERRTMSGITTASCEQVAQDQLRFPCVRFESWDATIR